MPSGWYRCWTHDDADGVLHVHNTGTGKRQHHQRDRRTALQQSGDQGSAADGLQPSVRILSNDPSKRLAGKGADGFFN